MAKVMISFPDDLLSQVDEEVKRLGSSRSAFLQQAARREIGLPANPGEIVARLEELASHWTGSGDAAKLIRHERSRDDDRHE